MKMSRRSIYACRAVLELAGHHGGRPVKVAEISRRRDIPVGSLEQILQLLKGAGLLLSRRGADGGYSLACDPGHLTVARVVEKVDGSVADGLHNDEEGEDVIGRTFASARDAARELLDSRTFAMLAEEEAGGRRP